MLSGLSAGDLYSEPTHDQLIASGFNRLHLIIDRGTALPEESYTRNVVDRVTAVGTAFMGLTVQCAVCHDHKYDPITMKDFYQQFSLSCLTSGNIDAVHPFPVQQPGLEKPSKTRPPTMRPSTAAIPCRMTSPSAYSGNSIPSGPR